MRLLLLPVSAILAGALLVTGCSGEPPGSAVQIGGPEPTTGVSAPFAVPSTTEAAISDEAGAGGGGDGSRRLEPEPVSDVAFDHDDAVPSGRDGSPTVTAAVVVLDEAAAGGGGDGSGGSEPGSVGGENFDGEVAAVPPRGVDDPTVTAAVVFDEAALGGGGDGSRGSESGFGGEVGFDGGDAAVPGRGVGDPTVTTRPQEMCVSDAAAPDDVSIVGATVAPSRFVITEPGQSFTAEVLVELSDPTDEAPRANVDQPVSFPDVTLSLSDLECTELDTAWRWTLTVSHPGQIVYPPGFVWEGAVAVETSDGLLTAPFTVEVGDTGSVEVKARAFLAGRLGVAVDEIGIAEVEPVTFNDGSMGCAQEGYVYTMAEVPGFIVTLTHGATTHVVHTDERGRHFVVPENCLGGFWHPR